MKKIMIILSFVFLLIGCKTNTLTVVDADTFFDSTTIESAMFDVGFSIANVNEMPDNYTTEPIGHIECTSLEEGLAQIDTLAFDEDEILATFEERENTQYFLVPIYNTWVIEDYEATYMYENNQLTIAITLSPSNFPMSTVNLIVFSINTTYDYDVVFVIDN